MSGHAGDVMSRETEQLLQAALALPATERVALAEQLIRPSRVDRGYPDSKRPDCGTFLFRLSQEQLLALLRGDTVTFEHPELEAIMTIRSTPESLEADRQEQAAWVEAHRRSLAKWASENPY